MENVFQFEVTSTGCGPVIEAVRSLVNIGVGGPIPIELGRCIFRLLRTVNSTTKWAVKNTDNRNI